jgi:serine/threonine protein phosphatase PrpC
MTMRPLFILLLGASSILNVAPECPIHGCSLSAIDIAVEGPEKEALEVLRRSTKSPGDNDNEVTSRKDALSTLQSAGDESSVTLTLCGYKGGPMESQINQDRSMLIRPYRIFPNQEQQRNSPAAQLLGVFDGHGTGGERTSQHALEQVPKLLAEKLAAIAGDDAASLQNQADAVRQALVEVFLEVDQTDPTKGDAGCTATVILQLGHKLFIANAGDSISFVGVYVSDENEESGGNVRERPIHERVQIVYKTREDKPDLPDERARILAAGGYVHVPANPDLDVPRAYHVDQDGQMLWGLAMSRSLGDWTVQGVIAEPIVDVLDVQEIIQAAVATHAETCNASDDTNGNSGGSETDQYCTALDPRNVHLFVVSATDGMMDELPPNYIGSVLARPFFDPSIRVHPITASEHLILESAKGWDRQYHGGYRDDIAIAAATIL